MPAAIADTGPLVAFLDRAERHHTWTVARIDDLEAPLLLCEPVLAQAMHLHLLARVAVAQDALLGLLENGALTNQATPTRRKSLTCTRPTGLPLSITNI